MGQTFQAITFSYLRSHRPGMGEGLVTCINGCKCAEQRIDSRFQFAVSVMVQHHIAVSAAPNCTLRITARELPPLPNRTNEAPGAGFKVMGVTVTGLRVEPQGTSLGAEMPFALPHGISQFAAANQSSAPPSAQSATPVPRAPPGMLHPSGNPAPGKAQPGEQPAATRQAGLPVAAPVAATPQALMDAAPPPSPSPPMPPAQDAWPAR